MEHELAPSSIEQEQIKAPASSSSVQAKSVVGGGRTHPVLGLQRKVGNRVVQGLVNADKSSVSPAIRTVLSSGGAQPLDPATQAFMEPRFGHDFSHVRVHTNERAAESARAVNALAYTVGQDVVFDTGQYAPYSSTGQSLLAHELAHVVQQGRGGVSPSPFTANTSNESAAREAASMVTSGSVANVGGASGVGVACMPRSSEVSSNLSGLNFTELEDRINEIQQHLDDNPVSSPENDQLMEEQSALRKELAKRQKQEKGGSKRRSQVSSLLIPRSLTESLRVDETLPEMELYHEINAIHATLESGVNKKDQEHLKAALAPLEAEKQRRERARKIQRAFAPKVTSTDGEALIEVMGLIESIHPSETMSGQYTFMRNGKMLMLTQEEYDKIRGAAQKILMDQLGRVRRRANDAHDQYNEQKKINDDQYIVSGVVHFFGGIDDPGSDIAQDVLRATLNADTAQVLIAHGQFKHGAELFTTSEIFATMAKKTSQAYVDDLISTAGTTVTVLEITRDAAFATTLALGAAVAAPVVAAGAAGFGLTGASAVAVTAVGTGGVIGVEGALLRGGSAAGGVAFAGGSLKDVVSAGESEGWRGFKEGAATGVGGGVAHSVGTVLKVGQSASKVVNIVRGSVVQGLGNAAGSATSTALEGGSVIDVLKSASKEGIIGTLTGPLSQGAGAIKNPVLGAIARTTVGGVVSGGQTYLETGNKEAAFRAAAIGGASSLAIGLGESNEGPTPAQKKAFEFGRAARSQVNTAARTVRSITAAAMLGFADAVPATRGTGAAVGNVVEMPVPAMSTAQGGPTVTEPLSVPVQSQSMPDEIVSVAAEPTAASAQRAPIEDVPAVQVTKPVQPTAEAVKRAELAVTDTVTAKWGHLGVRDISDLTKAPTTPGADRLFIVGEGDHVVLLEVDAKLSIQESPVVIGEVSAFETAAKSGGKSRMELLDSALKKGSITPSEYEVLRESVAQGLVLEEVHGFGSVSGISSDLRDDQVTYVQGEQFAHIKEKMAIRATRNLSAEIKATIVPPVTDRRTAKVIVNQLWKDFEAKFQLNPQKVSSTRKKK